MTYQVPLSYTINVSLSQTPSGLADFNTNSIAIFSNETAGFLDTYKSYITPTDVETDFGSDSITYAMAKALYTPVPNFRTGGGYLYIFPFGGENATPGAFSTPDLTANLANFQSLSDGGLNITIDGETYLVKNLDFTGVSSLADIVKVLNSKNLDVDITLNSGAIVFTSRRAGVASGVSISTTSAADVTDISGASYLNVSAGDILSGTDADGETLAEAVARAQQEVYFGGVLTTQIVDDATRLANSTAIQSMDCVYYDSMQSLSDMDELGASIKSAGNGKTRTLGYSKSNHKAAIATYATIAKSVNRNAANTANTLNLKTLTGIVADDGLTDSYVLSAKANGVDIYGNTGGLSVVYSNDNNGYTDDVENELWLKKAIEVAGFNYLRQTNTKIPQTEAGMAGLKNAYAQICEKGIANGVIGAGAWNSVVPFGDPETFKRNILEKGYYVYSLPIVEQTQADREARKAPVVQIAIKLSGAFHFSDVIITVER